MFSLYRDNNGEKGGEITNPEALNEVFGQVITQTDLKEGATHTVFLWIGYDDADDQTVDVFLDSMGNHDACLKYLLNDKVTTKSKILEILEPNTKIKVAKKNYDFLGVLLKIGEEFFEIEAIEENLSSFDVTVVSKGIDLTPFLNTYATSSIRENVVQGSEGRFELTRIIEANSPNPIDIDTIYIEFGV